MWHISTYDEASRRRETHRHVLDVGLALTFQHAAQDDLLGDFNCVIECDSDDRCYATSSVGAFFWRSGTASLPGERVRLQHRDCLQIGHLRITAFSEKELRDEAEKWQRAEDEKAKRLEEAMNALRRERGVVVAPNAENATGAEDAVTASAEDSLTAPSPRPAPSSVAQCRLFSPTEVAAGDIFLVQAFLLDEGTERAVDDLALAADAAARFRSASLLEYPLYFGAKVTFHLTVNGCDVEDPSSTVTWRGVTCSTQFQVRVPDQYPSSATIASVRVSVQGIPIARLQFTIKVHAERETQLPVPTRYAPTDRWTLRKAFASYASRDRTEVLKRVQVLRLSGIKVFQDVLDLEPGARWATELYKAIDKADLFLLFWSSAARDSEWVLKEARYALERTTRDPGRRPLIMPVIVEGPPPATPPPDLAHLHFDDPMIYFMEQNPPES